MASSAVGIVAIGAAHVRRSEKLRYVPFTGSPPIRGRVSSLGLLHGPCVASPKAGTARHFTDVVAFRSSCRPFRYVTLPNYCTDILRVWYRAAVPNRPFVISTYLTG